MNLKICILVFVVVCVSYAHSQTLSNKVVASGGSYSTATWGSLSATVGEAVITTLPSANVTLLQGFQQPTSGLAGITSKSNLIAATAYPNPAGNEAFLEVTLPTASTVYYKVFDTNGKQIIAGNYNTDAMHTTIQKLDISQLSDGMYLISLYTNLENIRNIKIQINH